MIIRYETLQKIVDKNKTLQLNDQSYIRKTDDFNGVCYVSVARNSRDYYGFFEIDKDHGITFYSDGEFADGLTVYESPLSDFYVDINTDKNILDIDTSAGSETNFLDIFTEQQLGVTTREYLKESDEQLLTSKIYQMVKHYISDYFDYQDEVETQISLKLIRFAMSVYDDQTKPIPTV